ncbi:MAG: putative lipid II flippase FtsW [Spirochaetaceae bacterium]|jgi:cell division protein FtsW|nr:putative lipid II flippase FtsW [Spirochaetaceae bacterium]
MVDRLNMEKPGRRFYADQVFIACTFLLLGVGLVTLYSASFAFANRFFGNGYYFINRQIRLGAVGIGFFIAAAFVPINFLRKIIVPLVFGTGALCILTFVPGIQVIRNGASRWISVMNSTYQPSELVKVVLPLYLAHIFDKKRDHGSFSRGVLPQAIITAVFFMLIYLQNNFSTALFIAVNGLFIFFIAGVKLRYFFSAAVLLFPVSILMILSKEHRLRRFMSFVRPDWEPLGAGYQVRSSLSAITSGGGWGKGIGQGTKKIASVPEIQSDFIFSSYAEEFGFLGIFLFFVVFAVFACRGYRAALRSEDTFRRLLAFGLVTTICSQVLVNVAVVAGILPATGIPLPFFSAGGSSLATTLIMAGLIANVSRHKKEPEADFGS